MNKSKNIHKFWHEKIPFLKKSKEFFNKIIYKDINLWIVMAGEIYIYYENSEKIWWRKIAMIFKSLFTLDKFEIIGNSGNIFVSYIMARDDHHLLVEKSIEDFPKNQVTILDACEYKKKKSFFKYLYRFPDIFLIYKIWKKFKNSDMKVVLGRDKYYFFLARTYFRCKQIDQFEKIYSQYKPKAYLAFCSSAFAEETILTLICKKNNVPTFTLQHGFIVEYNVFSPSSILSENVVSDFNFLWGKDTYDLLVKVAEPSRLLIAGNPKYNKMGKIVVKKFDPKKGILFLPVIGNDESSKKMLDIINNFAKLHPEIEFQLSLHPFDYIKNYNGITTSKNLKYFQSSNIAKSIEESDFIIIHNTTISIESLQYGKPIFRYDDKFLVKLWENDDCFKSADDLEKLFVKLEDSKIYQKWSKKYLQEFKNNFYLPKKGTVSENYYKEIMKRVG